MVRVALVLAVVALLAGCGQTKVVTVPAQPQTTGACKSDLRLPDRKCNPGLVGSKLKVCHEHTGDVRPPVSYTNALKVRQLKQYGYKDQSPAHYEEDHIVPLALGGNPTDPRNLWPEPRYGPFPAAAKDAIEFAQFKAVCDSHADLKRAQAIFLGDYTKPSTGLDRSDR